jgi:hypothetical protein
VRSTGPSGACIEVKTTGDELSVALLYWFVSVCFALTLICEYTNNVLATLNIDTRNAVRKIFVFMILDLNYFNYSNVTGGNKLNAKYPSLTID